MQVQHIRWEIMCLRKLSNQENLRSLQCKRIIDTKKQHREPLINPHFSCHHMRHTLCSRFCENEMNVKVFQEIMGHVNVETTLDIYIEVNFNKKGNLQHIVQHFGNEI